MADEPGTTVPPLPGETGGWWFHLRGGFYFKGVGDAVSIAVRLDDGTFRVVTVPPNEWASAVASVSKRGDTQSSWSDALKLHEAEPDGDV